MSILNKIYFYINNRVKWISYLNKKKTEGTSVDYINCKSMKCVALIPHADDELIGLHTFILNNDVHLIYFGYLGSNNTIDNQAIRLEEFKTYCDKIKCKYELFENKGLEELNDVDIVLLPSIVDWHDEHRKLNYVLRDYCHENLLRPRIIWYNISVYSTYKKHAKYISESREQINKKYRLFKQIYISQLSLPILRFKIKERLYGKEASTFAAEKFIFLDYSDWDRAVEKFDNLTLENETIKTKDTLNDFQKVNTISTAVYEKILGSEET